MKVRRGTIILEYALLLGAVSLALIMMNVYILRGMQGRVKDMTDGMISKYQLDQIDPATYSSTSETLGPSVSTLKTFVGGTTQTTASSKEKMTAQSEVEDRVAEGLAGIAPVSGYNTVSNYPTDSQGGK